MTAAEEVQLRALWAMYAGYYRQQIPDDVLVMYAQDLNDLGFEEIRSAFTAFRSDPKNRFLPLPAQIRDLINPRVSVESAAREIVAKISFAISRFGSHQSREAEAHIGPVGWSIVTRSGGWSYICSNYGVALDIGTFSAQARELAISALKYSPHQINEAVGLGSSPRGQLNTAGINYLAAGIGKGMP